jgi:uncharacterized membrane protein
MENQPQKPQNHLALAIISTLLCCLPLGIVSIVYASKVDGLYASGKYDEAQVASDNAKKWWIISAVAGVIVIILYFVFIGAAIFGAAANAN